MDGWVNSQIQFSPVHIVCLTRVLSCFTPSSTSSCLWGFGSLSLRATQNHGVKFSYSVNPPDRATIMHYRNTSFSIMWQSVGHVSARVGKKTIAITSFDCLWSWYSPSSNLPQASIRDHAHAQICPNSGVPANLTLSLPCVLSTTVTNYHIHYLSHLHKAFSLVSIDASWIYMSQLVCAIPPVSNSQSL